MLRLLDHEASWKFEGRSSNIQTQLNIKEDKGIMSTHLIPDGDNLFDIGDLYEQYKNAESDEEKEKLKEEIQQKVKDKMVVTRDRGKPVIAVKVIVDDPPPPTESILPIFGLATRTKGIGSANGLEIYQSAFGSLAFKNGNIDIDNWPDEDKKKVVNDQVKGIQNDIEDENINPETDEGMAELKDRIRLLERWDPQNKTLKKLKAKYGLK